MKLHALGTGDAFGSGGKLNSSYLIRTGDKGILVDCGASFLPSLKKAGFNTEYIDVIVITHFHGDHFGGLPYFILGASILMQRRKKLVIISPDSKKCQMYLKQLVSILYEGTENILESFPILYQEYEEPTDTYFKLSAYPVKHSPESMPHGIRLEIEGKVIAFSGDTEWTETLIPIAQKADLFICECNFYSLEVSNHLNYQTLEKHLPELNVKKILLTHPGESVFLNMDKIKLKYLEDGDEIEIE